MFLSNHSSPDCKHPFSLMIRSTRFPTSSVYVQLHKSIDKIINKTIKQIAETHAKKNMHKIKNHYLDNQRTKAHAYS